MNARAGIEAIKALPVNSGWTWALLRKVADGDLEAGDAIEALAAAHYMTQDYSEWDDKQWCAECGLPWRCPTYVFLRKVEAEQ